MTTKTASKNKAVNWPNFITGNTYFWNPGKTASDREFNRKSKILNFSYFMESVNNFYYTGECWKKQLNGDTCEIYFSWSESCKNVYRTFTVYINGKKSNRKGAERFMILQDNEK